ncbi:MAG TPA: hypothetical protein PLT47_02485 [Bacteroidales bacterium]|nr:hypothetical protein [Bacteroidales bacterium]HQI69589.1 hypothetical protein [Bacteroidales bacterium]
MKRIATVIVFCFYIFILPICAQNSSGADTIYYEIQGLILLKKNTEINVVINEPIAKMPALNTVGELSKSFEKEFAGTKITGWLTIGIVKIVGFKNQVIRFILIEEKSEITVDGVKQDHFGNGQTVKFTWKELAGPDQILFDKGLKEYDNKNKQAAMNYFKQVVVINPKHAEAINMIGILYHENSVYDSAVFYYKKAWKYDTANIAYIKNIAIASTNLDKYSEAYNFALKAVFHAPDDAEAHYLRAITYLYAIIYSLNGEMTAADKKQILSDMDFAVSVNENDSFYYKERMIIRSFFQDYTGACEDAKKYRALEGSAGDKFVIEYCN